MLKRTSDPGQLRLCGFLIGAEVQIDEVSMEYLHNKLSDALSHVEGVGEVEVEFLGEMDLEDEPPQGSV